MTVPTAMNGPGSVAVLEGLGMTWHHVKTTSRVDLDFIGKLFPVNEFDLEDCVSQKQLPTVVNRKDYLFAILHFPRFIAEKKTVVPRQIGIFLTDRHLITIYQSELKPVDGLFDLCERDAEARAELLDHDPGDLLWRLLDAQIDYLFPMLDKILQALEEVEDDVFDERVSATRTVNFMRRDITDQRRILFPMERMVSEIRVKAKRYSRNDLDLPYEDLHDRVAKVWNTLESARERVEIFKDADFVLSSEKTNKILAVLTILFTYSIPVTVLGTLYGMNVHLPGGIDSAWMFWGPYTTFFMVLLFSTGLTGFMAWIFHRMRWI